jgi:hypothetical protein
MSFLTISRHEIRILSLVATLAATLLVVLGQMEPSHGPWDVLGSMLLITPTAMLLVVGLPSIREWFRELLDRSMLWAFAPAALALSVVAVYLSLVEPDLGSRLPNVAVYLFVPALVYTIARPSTDPGDGLWARDLVVIAGLVAPIMAGLLTERVTPLGQVPVDLALGLMAGIPAVLLVRPTPGHGYNWELSWRDVGWFAGGLAVASAALIPTGLITGFSEPREELLPIPKMIGIGVYFFVLIGLGQELLFRGFLQNLLARRLKRWRATSHAWGDWLALIVTSLIFGVAHYPLSPEPGLYIAITTFLGLVVGYVWMRSGSLLAATLIHTGVNWVWVNFIPSPDGFSALAS